MKPVKEHDYTTYPRRFVTYRWYKPLLVGLLFVVFYLIFAVAIIVVCGVSSGDYMNYLSGIAGGYDTMDVSTVLGVITYLGSVVVMIPALFLAGLIVRDRPFSSYSSAMGGFRGGLFGKLLLVALLVCGVPLLVLELIGGVAIDNRFTTVSFLALTVFGPLQCIAEEYLFRGFLMQTPASWFRIPVIGILLQAVIFASLHPYNMTGVITIFATGVCMGVMAWICRGIEGSSAIHVVNNMIAFYLAGLGVDALGSEVSVEGLVVTVVIDLVYIIVLLILRKKTDWFERVRKDDVAVWNEKKEAVYAARAARRAARRGE